MKREIKRAVLGTFQFFVSDKSDEANSLETSGDPDRTRTCNPLLNPELLCSSFFKHVPCVSNDGLARSSARFCSQTCS